MNLDLYKKSVKGCIKLSASKSITNRVLILNALFNNSIEINNSSLSEDSQILKQILSSFNSSSDRQQEFNVGKAGTVIRFLTAYFASTPCNVVLTGDDRMKKRPIGYLVDALQMLGAQIEYKEALGFPPLIIKGKKLKGGKISIKGNISSQFITALLLIAPTLEEGLEIEYSLPMVSANYVRMTIQVLNYFGIQTKWTNNHITINKQNIIPRSISIEADWSSASYWYLIALLAPESKIFIQGLQLNSWQGDAIVSSLFENFGIKTTYFNNGICIEKSENSPSIHKFLYDFTNCPDLVQTLAVAVSYLKLDAELRGISTLRLKETDRIEALKTELKKFNVEVFDTEDTLFIRAAHFRLPEGEINIDTYGDHRMALAFAPLAFVKKELIIENPSVVNKSYPEFWDHLKLLTND